MISLNNCITYCTQPIMLFIKDLLGLFIHTTNMDCIALTLLTRDCLVSPAAGHKVVRTDEFSTLSTVAVNHSLMSGFNHNKSICAWFFVGDFANLNFTKRTFAIRRLHPVLNAANTIFVRAIIKSCNIICWRLVHAYDASLNLNCWRHIR
jgi:hypothetical protein